MDRLNEIVREAAFDGLNGISVTMRRHLDQLKIAGENAENGKEQRAIAERLGLMLDRMESAIEAGRQLEESLARRRRRAKAATAART